MKKDMKKLLAVICAIALLITGSGLELLFGANGPSEVQAADAYTLMGFEEFGITEEKKWGYSDLGQYGNRSFQASDATQSIHLKEVEGIVNVASGTSKTTNMVFGGPYNNGVTLTWNPSGYIAISYKHNGGDQDKAYVDSTGAAVGSKNVDFAVLDNDLIVNVKFNLATPNAATSDVTFTVTITDADDTGKTYTGTFTQAGVKTEYLTQKIHVMHAYYDGQITLKPYTRPQPEPEYTRMGFEEFGITEEKKWGYSDLGTYGNRSFGASDPTQSIHLKEVEGIVNVASGTSKTTNMVFGGPYNNGVTLTWNPSGYIAISYKHNGGDQDKAYVDSTGAAVGSKNVDFDVLGNDLIVNVKFNLATPNAATSDVTFTVTITDADDTGKTYTGTFTQAGVKTEYLTQKIHVMHAYYDGQITLKPYTRPVEPEELEYTRMGFDAFGITEEKKWGYSDLGQYGNRSFQASDATKSLHLKEVEGIVNVASGGSAVTYMVFGGPHNNGVTLIWNPAGYITISYKHNGVDQAKAYVDTDGSTGGKKVDFPLLDNDLIINVKFNLATPDAATSDVTFTVTITDADDASKTYTGTFTQAGVNTEYLTQRIHVLHAGFDKQVTLKPSTRWTTLNVGGADTNTTVSNIYMMQGEELPTGYAADGKYILGWTADGSEVTTYDSAKTNYVAKFVDTKMLKVGKQHKVETDGTKTVRFIATLDKLEGYEEAGFVFANKDMGELTLDNKGAIAQLNIAYTKLNANGVALSPEETGVYDAYSNYFVAYPIKKIPAGVTLYARAYVIIDGVTIYGDMMSVSVNELN